MAPAWPEGRKREYHAITRGWLANEIFRRVHPGNKRYKYWHNFVFVHFFMNVFFFKKKTKTFFFNNLQKYHICV